MLDGLSKWLDVERVTDALKATADKDTEHLLIIGVKICLISIKLKAEKDIASL